MTQDKKEVHTEIGIVARLDDQGDRVLVYPEQGKYAIASKKQVEGLNIGDEFRYQPDRWANFVWFHSKVEKSEKPKTPSAGKDETPSAAKPKTPRDWQTALAEKLLNPTVNKSGPKTR